MTSSAVCPLTTRAFAAAAVTQAGQNPEVNAIVAAGAHAQALMDRDVGLLRQAVEQAAASEDRLLEAAAREDLGQVRLPAARANSVSW